MQIYYKIKEKDAIIQQKDALLQTADDDFKKKDDDYKALLKKRDDDFKNMAWLVAFLIACLAGFAFTNNRK